MIVCPCAQIRTGHILLYCDVKCRDVSRRSRGQFQGVPNSQIPVREKVPTPRLLYIVIRSSLDSYTLIIEYTLSTAFFFKFTVIVLQLYCYRFSRRFFNLSIIYYRSLLFLFLIVHNTRAIFTRFTKVLGTITRYYYYINKI